MSVKESDENRIGSGKPGPGRPRGMPNKATAKAREVIALIADEMAGDFKSWLFLTASGDEERGIKPDPKGAADLYLKAIEYHIPKLSRVEGHLATEHKTHEQWISELE
ncbi:hypothetical protein M8R20_26270 [Pseudomonas sp. R2.Fl]|nr:hypothetical protein [Pseudomonas sp. R2.Fl]